MTDRKKEEIKRLTPTWIGHSHKNSAVMIMSKNHNTPRTIYITLTAVSSKAINIHVCYHC